MKSLIFSILITCFTLSAISQQIGSFTDKRDGKTYKTVKIGKQHWMAENLAFKIANGCWAYDNHLSNGTKYGYLYNWETAKKVCPVGWHLPSDEEWKQLEIFLGMNKNEADKTEWRSTIGINLKGKEGWYKSGNGTNSSGFNALPAGGRLSEGSFYGVERIAGFWSSSTSGNEDAWYRYLDHSSGEVGRYFLYRSLGCSVRCLKD